MFTRGEGNEQVALFELLSHPHRRFVLRNLVDADGPQSVHEVASDLAAWQVDVPVADRSATGVDAIESALHHCHLPKMVAAGVLEYDRTRGTVTLDVRARELPSALGELGGSTAPVERDTIP